VLCSCVWERIGRSHVVCFENGRLPWLLTVCAVWIASAGIAQGSDAKLSGYVKNENEVPVAGAIVTVRPVPPAGGGPWQAQTDPADAFSIVLPAPGDYLVNVQPPLCPAHPLLRAGQHPLIL